jgi:hypothetical protein
MPDLSAYADFSVVLDYNASEFRLTDTSVYPAGLAEFVVGSVSILQPDGITTPGSLGDVSFVGSSLTVCTKELRRDYKGQPQNGTYVITYTVTASGYDDTTVIKSFSLNYTEPVQSIVKGLNVFTPQLRLIDSTSYVHSGLALQSVARVWTITSPLGTTGGTGQTVDVSYGGQYYDALYTAVLDAVVEYDINSWATILDKVSRDISFQANTPPTIAGLRQSLVELKQRIDDCYPINDDYQFASALFNDFLDRGRSQDYDGLVDYIGDLQKIFAGGYTPVYVNTNNPIPAYDWESAGISTVDWDDVINKPSPFEVMFKVGQSGFPSNGTSIYTNSQFANRKLMVSRNSLTQWSTNPADGNSYYEQLGTQVTFYPALVEGESIHIIAL